MNAKVILNPYSRRWDALRRRPEAEASLQAAGISYELIQTEYPGHGILLAAQATAEGYNPIIAAGGDSTVNEIVNGILQTAYADGKKPTLGVLPMGTANDLADNLGISKDLSEAARIIRDGVVNNMDVCQVNDRYFVNNSGVGLEPYITTIQMEIHRVQGIVRYLLATLIGIYRKPEWEMEIRWDTGEYIGPATLVSIGNSPRTGGLFFLTPHANAFDGLLTFLCGSAPSRLQLLQMLPKAMRPEKGNVSEDKRAFEVNTTRLSIRTSPPTPVHADGEIFSRDAVELNYGILPGFQPILLPKQMT
jgi:diacylglycerol kinase (ATP)